MGVKPQQGKQKQTTSSARLCPQQLRCRDMDVDDWVVRCEGTDPCYLSSKAITQPQAPITDARWLMK